MKFENFEKWDMIVCFIQSGENADAASNLYHERYPERRQPFRDIFPRLRRNLINCGQFVKKRPERYAANRDRELEEVVVLAAVENNPSTSTRQLKDATGISRTTAMRVLKKNKFKPYRDRKVHHLQPGDFERRIGFCHWFLEKCNHVRDFPLKCIWTDEAYVSSAGIYNRYNSYTWAQQNPHAVVEQRNQGRFGFSVWAGIFRGRIIGPHIYNGTLTSETYVQILRQHIEPLVDDLPLEERRIVFYQHDGAPPHNAAIARDFLATNFGNNWIANQGPSRWPPRSPDLTPMDFYLWGRLKDIIYKLPKNSRLELEAAVMQGFASLTPIEIINSVRHVQKACRLCIRENGRHFEHLLV